MFRNKHKSIAHRSVDYCFCAMVFGVEPHFDSNSSFVLRNDHARLIPHSMTVGFVIPSHAILQRLDVSIASQDVTVIIWGFTLSHVPSVAMQP